MAPWFAMPTGVAATRRAVLTDLELTLAGIDCLLHLLAAWSRHPVQLAVLAAVEQQVDRAQAAVARLEREGGALSRGC